MKRIFALYRLLQTIGFPFILLYFALRGLKDRRYLRRFGERLGRPSYRQTAPGAIWLHAVSVGEVLSSMELLRRLRVSFPSAPLFVSTTTVAGRALADEKLHGLADGVFFCPIDYCFAVRGALRALRPRALVVLETEIWPNLYREARRSGCALLVVNGRISDRALPRYRRWRWFFGPVLQLPDAVLAQTELSAARFLELGAPAGRVRTAGNLKYDFSPRGSSPPEAVRTLLQRLRPAEVWVAASTMPPAEPGDPDEDQAVADAFATLAATHPGLLLILVPRKPERFDAVAGLLRGKGVPFVRRSALSGHEPLVLPGVLLLDSIGELSSLFPLASVVFMGGTLPHRGGHNVLEPAFFARAVVVGPHMENFPEIAERFDRAGAFLRIESAAELGPAVDRLLRDGGLRQTLGERARMAAESERGAASRVLTEIQAAYWRAVPRYRQPAPVRWALWPITWLWMLGGVLKRRRGLARQARLATPVISVGGLTVGGSGKSPLVLWLAERLHAAGFRPAILTRGYRRRAPEPSSILAPGEPTPVARTGDEAQAYVRAGVGPVGIGAGRAAAGRLIEKRFSPDLFLLDDGFQHARLARDLDIVVIDALDPFGGEELVPLGRLREPLSSLARAGVFLLTRLQPGQLTGGLEARIRRYNPAAPIFTSRVVVERWTPEAPLGPVAAFCGLGNPAAFWQTLAAGGFAPVFQWSFPDHHRYRRSELLRLAVKARKLGARTLLTTEKDFFNLPEGWEASLGGLRLLYPKVGMEVERAEEFLSVVTAVFSSSSRKRFSSSPPP